MDQPDLSIMDHAAEDDLIRFRLAETAKLKSHITALEVHLATRVRQLIFQLIDIADRDFKMLHYNSVNC